MIIANSYKPGLKENSESSMPMEKETGRGEAQEEGADGADGVDGVGEETWKLIGNYDRECKEHTQGLYLVAQHEEHLTHSWGVRDSFVVEIVSNGNLEWKKKRPS